MLKYDTIKTQDDAYLMKTYNRLPALMVQGSGCTLWDNRGKEYLDMLAGIAVCSLGHCHPAVVSAITRQAQQLIHCSGLILSAPQAQLAAKLCAISGMDRVWFGNDGASANEAALKIAKKHGNQIAKGEKFEIVCLEHSFHGRTMGALSATGTPRYQDPFAPLVPGFIHIPANDIAALKAAVSEKACAIHLEPVMGEGGILVLDEEFLLAARELADQFNALLIFDEVQSGIGRTGKWFAYQHTSVVPDVVCLAKGLGSGFPIGAVLAKGAAAEVLQPGDHGSTFGGNPLACATALAVVETIEHQGLLEHTQKVGKHLQECLGQFDAVKEVTGLGLMVGAVLKNPIGKDLVAKCFEKGLIINATSEGMLRFVPALVVTEAQIDQAMTILAEVLEVKPPAAVTVSSPQPKLHDFLSIRDLSDAQLEEALSLAAFLKERRALAPSLISGVEGRSVALVFEKPSLRTRVSFETAIRELGGHPIYLSKADIGVGSRESIKDVASNLAGWCAAIVARLYWHKDIEEFARCSPVPVINALTEMEHPCQALADMQTVREEFGKDKVKIAYVGDGNNVSRSLAQLATRLGYPMTIVGPENFRLEEMPGLHQTSDLEEGLEGAQVVYTDVWISMGDEHEQEHRMKIFDSYQVNAKVMDMAAKDAIFMHCLPARRGYEVTDEVMDADYSRVVVQAENRLHAQKALLKMVLGL